MNFTMPDSLDGLTVDQLDELYAKALEDSKGLSAIADEDLTDENLADMELIADALDTLSGRKAEIEQAEQERRDRVAAARQKLNSAEEAPEEEPVAEETVDEPAEDEADVAEESDEPVVAEEDSAPEEPVTVPDDASELTEHETEKEKELVAASNRSVAQVAAKAPIAEDIAEAPKATLVAAANVPGFQTGQELPSMDDLAQAFLSRSSSFGSSKGNKNVKTPEKYGLSNDAQSFSVARIQKAEGEFSTGMDESYEKQMETVMAAAKEARLPGGSLTAAGGWCAPSEILYSQFCELESTAGLLSIPEVTARRGGIQFTKGPSLADLLSDPNFGFLQTEAQAEAGTEKVCYAVPCPDFEEVRLDAIGFCLTAGVLTNRAYPELVRRVLELAVVGHARKLNADTINRISTAIGTATDYVEVGASTSDVLDALTIQALALRYQYSMAPNATIEVVLPFWARDLVRADVSRRTGVEMLAVTDAQIANWFAVRNLSVQYVYDYQPFDTTATTGFTGFPTTLEAMLYPAGAFVRLASDVIDLNAIYDSVGLSTNTYTAAFFEEGTAVANTCGEGRKVVLDVNVYGNTGAANVPAGS